MPRRARIVLARRPHHIIQRGHNRNAVFGAQEDYYLYLASLREWKEKLGCRLYAYCLMTNHVHLVVDSGEDSGNLGLLMKRVAARQTRWVNKRKGRSGTLWEGRYKSSPIDSQRYLLVCCRYVELNPVRAGLVGVPEDYPWSSYGARVNLRPDALLDPLPWGMAWGPAEAEGAAVAPAGDAVRGSVDFAEWYRAWMRADVPEGEWNLLRLAVQRGQLTGDERFIDAVSREIGRRVEQRGPGNPRKRRARRRGAANKSVPFAEPDGPPHRK